MAEKQQHQQPGQKVSAWDKAKHGGKATFDKGWAAFEKLGVPVNKLTNKIGSEAFWPTQLGPECDKAARILKSFCSKPYSCPVSANNTNALLSEDGFYTEQPPTKPGEPGPKNKPKVLVKIPQKVIQNCVGLAIFSTMRTGLWVSGAGGSGVLIARKEDGTWSPPSGILIHTLGVGWMVGVDIYDCVIVINNRKALEAFSKMRLSIGGEVSVVAGPVGTGGILESEILKSRKPVFSYMKSRGLYAGVQADGTIIIERNDENARFYGERIGVGGILAGHVKNVPAETRLLMEVVKQAEGRTDVNQNILQNVDAHPAPSDVPVESISQPTAAQQTQFAPPPQTAGGPPPEGYYAPPAQSYPADYKHPSGATHPPTGESSYAAPPPAQSYPTDYKHSSDATHPPTDEAPPYTVSPQTPPAEIFYPPPPSGPPPHASEPYYAPPPTASGALQPSEPQMFYPPPPQGSNTHQAQEHYPPPPPGPPPHHS